MLSIHTKQQPSLTEQNDEVIALPKPVIADCQTIEARSTHPNLSTSEKSPDHPTLNKQTMMIAHEMQSPLCVILNVLSSCKKAELAPLEQERLTLALEEAERLERVVSEILDYARSANTSVWQWEDIRFRDLLHESIHLSAEWSIAKNRRIVIASSPPDVIIRGNRDKLKQVFLNLLFNACEAAYPGQIITVYPYLNPDTQRVIIQIHNRGKSVPTHLLPLLGHQQVTTKPSGHGLGLILVKKIVDAHAGAFAIGSSERRGTMVRVQLPVLQTLNPQSASRDSLHDTALCKPLSERELEVLQLIVAGYKNLAIAQTLFLSLSTVKGHVRSLMKKLGAGDRAQVAIQAIRLGLSQ